MNPKRGEIWLVKFNPQVVTEIMKTRPAVVLTIKRFERRSTRVLVPMMDYKDHHDGMIFYLVLEPTKRNNIDKKSTVDCLQVKSFDMARFVYKIGEITEAEVTEMSKVVSYIVGHATSTI